MLDLPGMKHPGPKIRMDSIHKSFTIEGQREPVLAGVDLSRLRPLATKADAVWCSKSAGPG